MRRGFTLLEIICAAGILSLAAALALPQAMAVRELWAARICRDNRERIGLLAESEEERRDCMEKYRLCCPDADGEYAFEDGHIVCSVHGE